jgi:ferredoxin
MNKVEKIVRLVVCALSCPAEAITMKAEERKADEKHLYREEKYASIYEINMLRCIFCGLCEEACPKDAIYLTTSKVLVPSSYEREDFIFGKDKLVMPLDIAMQNAQLKTLTNVYSTYFFCVLAAVTLATAFFNYFSRNPIHSAIYLVICFFRLQVITCC